jgi:hypothetical protein
LLSPIVLEDSFEVDETGYSLPNKSIISVYSLKFTLISFLPAILAKLSTKLVLPTPGGPSIKIGLVS